MAEDVLEIVGLFLGLVGLVGVSVSTGLPTWKVTAFIGENIIVMETRWEGLWMNCFRQANIRMQCKVYDSLLYLPPELQAARGLMCCSMALAGVGVLVGVVGMRCTTFLQRNNAKRLVLIGAGGTVILSSFCVLIPVSWAAHVIIQDFYNPLLLDAQRRELGEALYIGWASGVSLFAGGCIYTCCTSSRSASPPIYRRPTHTWPKNPIPLTQPFPQLANSLPTGSVHFIPTNQLPYPTRLLPDQPGSSTLGGHHSSSYISSLPSSSYISQQVAQIVPIFTYSPSVQPLQQEPVLIRYQSFIQPQPSLISSNEEYI